MFDVFMKELIPNGNGAYSVHKFVKNTEEGAKQLRDTLLACAWGDATPAEYDNFCSAVPAIAGILNGEVWVKQEAEEPAEEAGEAAPSEDSPQGEESPE